MKVRVSGKARAELKGIFRYLADKNPAAAENFIADVHSKLGLLARFPFMGRERMELAPSLRSVLVWSYVMFYRVETSGVVVVRVVDGRMDIDKEFRN